MESTNFSEISSIFSQNTFLIQTRDESKKKEKEL
jgi:hypothetical protein